jgi:outer membrane protein TolC
MPPGKSQFVALVGCALLGACNDTRNLAPASASTPWQFRPEAPAPGPSVSATVARPQYDVPENTEASSPPSADISPDHVYSLVELIDIAQRRNPATRVAWEQAQQAAINVGIARAAYLPVLTASALVGYEHIVGPFPSNLVPQGFIEANIQEVVPQIAINYLLLDFGGRAARVEEAEHQSFAANVKFTAAHQRLIFNVARMYFVMGGTDAAVRAAQFAVADARVVQQSAEALSDRGLATVVEVQLARRGAAQAEYDLAQAKAAQSAAHYSLLAALHVDPTTNLRIADVSQRPLPTRTARAVDDVLKDALRRRPDLLAEVAKIRASDANIAAARSALAPKVSLSANLQGNISQMSVDNSPYLGVARPQSAVLLKVEWPLYDGGLLQNKLRIARSQRDAAESQLKEQTDQALREVALAYDQVNTGLDQYNAATALLSASETAFRGASASYTQGIGTLTDAASAQTGLAQARAAVVQAHAQSLINAAALAFATGELTSSGNFATGAR